MSNPFANPQNFGAEVAAAAYRFCAYLLAGLATVTPDDGRKKTLTEAVSIVLHFAEGVAQQVHATPSTTDSKE